MTNKVILIGNLTRDPELKETPTGVAVCKFSVAVGRNFISQDGEKVTDFFNCTAWKQTAEAIAKYCKKGNKVCVIGSMQSRIYDDKNGVKRTAWEINVAEVEFLTAKAAQDDENGVGRGNTQGQSKTKSRPVLTPMDDDDDLPF